MPRGQVYGDRVKGEVDARGWTGQQCLTTFPGDFFPSNTSDAVQRAVLADSTFEGISEPGLQLI